MHKTPSTYVSYIFNIERQGVSRMPHSEKLSTKIALDETFENTVFFLIAAVRTGNCTF